MANLTDAQETARPALPLRALFLALAVTVVMVAHAPLVAMAARIVA